LRVKAGRPRKPCEHVAVATIVAAAADDADAARLRPARSQALEGRGRGPLHQLVPRDAVLLDRSTIECAHLGNCIQRRHRHAAIIVSPRGSPPPMSAPASAPHLIDYARLALDIKRWGSECGFQQIGISGIELDADEARLLDWLASGHHGEMGYMERHGLRRSRP